MYDPVFFDDLRRYKNVLRQRNAAIKEQRYELLDIYDDKLVRYGMPIMKARSSVCSSFSAIFPDIYNNVSLEDRGIQIKYRPSWGEDESYENLIEKLYLQRETDIKMSTTTSGPHRDRFLITDRNGVFVNGASTGQMRLASLVFRSAQAAFFRQKTGMNPIFLIDDVLLELDAQKRARYLSYLGHYNQAFFTFLPEEKYFGSFIDYDAGDTIRYRVEGGRFING
jgi:DNA replication and repair protein RecF